MSCVHMSLADVVQRADVGMVELRDRARLAVEAGLHVGSGGEGGVEDFDGDDAVEAGIARSVDLAHAAGADAVEDLVRAEPGAGSQGHECCGLYGHSGTVGQSFSRSGSQSARVVAHTFSIPTL